jgi:hypothetical protein
MGEGLPPAATLMAMADRHLCSERWERCMKVRVVTVN